MCYVDGCQRKTKYNNLNLCGTHYERLRKYGSVDVVKTTKGRTFPREKRECEFDGCNDVHKASGLCMKHYARTRRNGDPEVVMKRGPVAEPEHIRKEKARVRNRNNQHIYRAKHDRSRTFPPEFELSDRCDWCGATEDLTIEHWQPVSRGGDNSIDNLGTLCRSCNCSKNNRTLIEFIMGLSRNTLN